MRTHHLEVPQQFLTEIVATEGEVTAKDITQQTLLSEEELKNVSRIEESDKIVKDIAAYLDRLVLDVRTNGNITGAITMLMFLNKNDEEIVRIGRRYFIKHVTSSVPILQIILRDIKERDSLPNSEESLRGIRIVKEICVSLINEFGII